MAAMSSCPPSFSQIDDQRRTHNYDEFICTFISMLAQEGEGSPFCTLPGMPCSELWPSGLFFQASLRA